MNRAQATALLLSTLFAGCANVRSVEIQTNPTGAEIAVDGTAIGLSPVIYEFDFAKADRVYRLRATREGYVDGEKKVSLLHLDLALEKGGNVAKEIITVTIEEDEAWTQTATSSLANQWIEIEVNPELDKAQVWELMTDIVTEYYSELTNQDSEAGYIAAKQREKRFKRGPTATVLVRNQFFCSLATRSPLVYKIKIESQLNENGTWRPFDRIFKKDAKLITDVEARLVLQQ